MALNSGDDVIESVINDLAGRRNKSKNYPFRVWLSPEAAQAVGSSTHGGLPSHVAGVPVEIDHEVVGVAYRLDYAEPKARIEHMTGEAYIDWGKLTCKLVP